MTKPLLTNQPMRTTRADYPSDEEIEKLFVEKGFIQMIAGVRDKIPNLPINFKFNDERKMAFIRIYSETGNFAKACASVEMSRQAVFRHTKNDPVFKMAVEEARHHFAGILHDEVVRRAVTGVKQNVIGGRNKDKIVDIITVYSDPLLIRLGNQHIPGFAPEKKVTIDKTNTVDITVRKTVDYSKLNKDEMAMVRKLLTKKEPEIQEIEDAIIIEEEDDTLADGLDKDQIGLF